MKSYRTSKVEGRAPKFNPTRCPLNETSNESRARLVLVVLMPCDLIEAYPNNFLRDKINTKYQVRSYHTSRVERLAPTVNPTLCPLNETSKDPDRAPPPVVAISIICTSFRGPSNTRFPKLSVGQGHTGEAQTPS